MRILLATITARRSRDAAPLLEDYLKRAGRYCPCEHRDFPTEAKLLEHLRGAAGRTTPRLVLTDSRGKQVSSEQFAGTLGRWKDSGAQQIVVAIGPADGWSPAAIEQADLTIAFGRITLPHELAAIVAAEQVYRALTILAGHPYHSGH